MIQLNVVHACYIRISKRINEIKWLSQLHTYSEKCNVEQIKGKKTLVIAPHADDELIGCYGYITEYMPHVLLCSMTGSKTDIENKKIRENEFVSFCQSKKIPYSISTRDLSIDLYDLLQSFKPERILLPSKIDWHGEHRLVNDILLDLLLELDYRPEIVWYQISVPIPNNRVNYVYRLTRKIIDEKWDAFIRFYQSQLRINYHRFIFLDKNQYKDGSYEKYFKLSFEQWKDAVNELNNLSARLDGMKVLIDDLRKIYISSSDLYDDVLGGIE